MKLELRVGSMEVQADDGMLELVLYSVRKENVLDHFELMQVVRHFGAEALLDEIGKDACIAHFDLQKVE